MIGIFDSGSGGLTVLKELKKKASNVDIVYFGDIKNVPYGNKSREELGALTLKAIDILSFYGSKKIISACNSVSETIIKSLTHSLSSNGIEIVEMVEPTARELSRMRDKKILVVSTRATHKSGIYRDACKKNGCSIESISIPNLAEKIERGANKDEIKKTIESVLDKIKTFDGGMVVLGCTQFPLAEGVFYEIFGENNLNIKLFNPAQTVAQFAIDKFEEEGDGNMKFLLSKDSKLFRKRVQSFYPDNLYEIEII